MPKAGEADDSNADSSFVGPRRAAIADGVSRSFDPRRWAQVLAEFSSVSDIDTAPTEMARGLAASLDLPHPDDLPWNEAALREEGCRSTLLVVEWVVSPDGVAFEFRAVGDCVAIVESHDEDSPILWPFTAASEFPPAPDTWSTEPPFLVGEVLRQSITVRRPKRLILMSDALGRHALSRLEFGATVSEALPFLSTPDRASFVEWVDDERESGRLEDDDTTVVVLERW